jgi:predicted metal-dependent hydrolase
MPLAVPTPRPFQIEDIHYTLERRRRRTVALYVLPQGQVTVRAPLWLPSFQIHSFVRERLPWVRKTLQRVQARPQPAVRQYVAGERVQVWGCSLTLAIESAPKNELAWTIQEDLLVLRLAPRKHTPDWIRRALQTAYRQAVEVRVKEILPALAEKLGVRPGRIQVGFAKYRWGSCSRNGGLRFNARLAMMPPAMLEYVVVHELTHLREMNHSKRFWSIVSVVLPDHKERRRWIRREAAGYTF